MGGRRASSRASSRPTLADVASRAGVSPATVSRALTRGDTVRSDTRRRVLAAVEALDYRPNRAARGLSTGRSGALGMIVPDISNPFFAALIRAAQSAARARDKVLLIADSGQSEDQELDLLQSLAGQVDGLIVCSPGLDADRLEAQTTGVPIVFVNRRADGIPAVVIDQAAIVRASVGHLRQLGHRHLSFLAGPERLWSSQRRLEAVRELEMHGEIESETGNGMDVERANGLRIDVLGPFEPNFEGGAQAAEAITRSGATGVLAFNDVMALGLMTRLAAMGVGVPEQLSIVGSDDVPLARMWTPALTTVSAPTGTAGESAVDLLSALIEGGSSGALLRGIPEEAAPVRRLELEGQLVVRSSTARVRS